jgi:O-acetyl-ADP-ribose deacetylase
MSIEYVSNYNSCSIGACHGDIARLSGADGIDAIVNPANKALCLGLGIRRPAELFLGLFVGGVAKHIGKMAGARVKRECRRLIRERGWLAAGGAVYTSGGDLEVKYIIHVASTNFLGSSELQIRKCVKNAFDLANELDIQGLALPLIGSGAGRISKEDSLGYMCDELKTYLDRSHSLQRVAFALLSKRDYAISVSAAKQAFG